MHGSWSVRLEPNEGAAFLAIVNGSCWLLPNSGEPIFASKGDVVLLLSQRVGLAIADSHADLAAAPRAAVPFSQWRRSEPTPVNDRELDVLCGKYQVDFARLHPLLNDLPSLTYFSAAGGGNDELQAAIFLLAREQGERRAGSSVAIRSMLDFLLLTLVRAVMGARESGAGLFADPVVAAALRALHSDPAAPWTNADLAAAVGVSRPTLARRFSATVGRPPMAYFTWWRMTRAAILLRETPDTLASIARTVGYGSPYAFSHAFEREFGTTPGRYRCEAAAHASAA